MASKKTIGLTLKLAEPAYKALFRRAQAAGYVPSTFAQLLFEAAYAARVAREGGTDPTDVELDEQVRLVFACAGQADTAAIARATGLPETRVVRILKAWRQVAREEGEG